jgi:hypothetical protein
MMRRLGKMRGGVMAMRVCDFVREYHHRTDQEGKVSAVHLYLSKLNF